MTLGSRYVISPFPVKSYVLEVREDLAFPDRTPEGHIDDVGLVFKSHGRRPTSLEREDATVCSITAGRKELSKHLSGFYPQNRD